MIFLLKNFYENSKIEMRESPFSSFKETFIFYFIRKAAKMEQQKAIMLMLVNDFMEKKINRRRKRMFRISTIIRNVNFQCLVH